MENSKLSSKGQISIPQMIRKAINIAPGDRVSYEVKDNSIIIRKFEPIDMAFHAAVESGLEEWNTPEDDEAFRDL